MTTIHQLQTGLLFHRPLFGPERSEKDLDGKVFAAGRLGLGQFGLGCQLLDDLRDRARDHIERRHNYGLSLMAHQCPSAFKRLEAMGGALPVDMPIFLQFADEMGPVARLAYGYMVEGLRHLNACGLGLGPEPSRALALWMFKALDVDKAKAWLA